MSGDNGSDFNEARAEVFEAIGHSTRIRILKALSEGPVTFSELKKAVGIESSGHLEFHLRKLAHLIRTDPNGAYVLTDDGKEAIRIIDSLRSEKTHEGTITTTSRNVRWTKVALTTFAIGLLILGSVAVFQQSQISGLSGVISSQSSELFSPVGSMTLQNFTVTQANSSARPMLTYTVWNNGSTPINSLSVIAIVYGDVGGGTLQPCYNASLSNALVSNESLTISNLLGCGNVGDRVGLTVTAEFLGRFGTTLSTRTLFANITPAPVFDRSPVVVKQLGVVTYLIPFVSSGTTLYGWQLRITNDGQQAITGISAQLNGSGGHTYVETAFFLVPTNTFLAPKSPLLPSGNCWGGTDVSLALSGPAVGNMVQASITVTYLNGTVSTASIEVPVQ